MGLGVIDGCDGLYGRRVMASPHSSPRRLTTAKFTRTSQQTVQVPLESQLSRRQPPPTLILLNTLTRPLTPCLSSAGNL